MVEVQGQVTQEAEVKQVHICSCQYFWPIMDLHSMEYSWEAQRENGNRDKKMRDHYPQKITTHNSLAVGTLLPICANTQKSVALAQIELFPFSYHHII